MEALKAFGSMALGLAFFAGLLFLGVLYFQGIAWVSVHIVQYMLNIFWLVILGCVVVLLLAPFRATRIIPAFGLLAASVYFGATAWVLGFLTTYDHWGLVGVIIGMVIAGVGVVPLGMIASAIHSEWSAVLILGIGLVLTYGARMCAFWLASKVDEDRFKAATTIS